MSDTTVIPASLAANLSSQERRVLERLLAGDAEKQIAITLSLSPHTVHHYVKVVYKTLGVHTRAELMSLVISTLSHRLRDIEQLVQAASRINNN